VLRTRAGRQSRTSGLSHLPCRSERRGPPDPGTSAVLKASEVVSAMQWYRTIAAAESELAMASIGIETITSAKLTISFDMPSASDPKTTQIGNYA
jgi:hypothetical protein